MVSTWIWLHCWDHHSQECPSRRLSWNCQEVKSTDRRCDRQSSSKKPSCQNNQNYHMTRCGWTRVKWRTMGSWSWWYRKWTASKGASWCLWCWTKARYLRRLSCSLCPRLLSRIVYQVCIRAEYPYSRGSKGLNLDRESRSIAWSICLPEIKCLLILR